MGDILDALGEFRDSQSVQQALNDMEARLSAIERAQATANATVGGYSLAPLVRAQATPVRAAAANAAAASSSGGPLGTGASLPTIPGSLASSEASAQEYSSDSSLSVAPLRQARRNLAHSLAAIPEAEQLNAEWEEFRGELKQPTGVSNRDYATAIAEAKRDYTERSSDSTRMRKDAAHTTFYRTLSLSVPKREPSSRSQSPVGRRGGGFLFDAGPRPAWL
jgi:hypothetical protein